MTDKSDPESPSGQPAGTPQIVENLFCAEVYADFPAFFSSKGGNISITLVSNRFDSADQGTLKQVVVGRLVMPLGGAQGLAIGLYDFLAQHGMAPPKADSQQAN